MTSWISLPSQGHKIGMETLTHHPTAGKSGSSAGGTAIPQGADHVPMAVKEEKSPLQRQLSEDAPE